MVINIVWKRGSSLITTTHFIHLCFAAALLGGLHPDLPAGPRLVDLVRLVQLPGAERPLGIPPPLRPLARVPRLPPCEVMIHPHVMSLNLLVLPICQRLELICSIRFTQPPVYIFFGQSPLSTGTECRTSYVNGSENHFVGEGVLEGQLSQRETFSILVRKNAFQAGKGLMFLKG